MLRRITLQNFMSHKHTVIDLAEGLTVLTGPNNCGKSAVVAALQILATNTASSHVVRHGEKECTITAETDDGHTLCWNRRKRKISYTLNGEDIHRLGRSEVPQELQSLLKLPTVETEAGKTAGNYDVHFGEQKSPIFLLGDPGSRAASFFASSSDATHLITMQHRHRQRVTEQKRDAKKLESAAATTTADLGQFATMDEVEQRLQNAEQDFAKINSVAQTIAYLRQLTSDLIANESNIARLSLRSNTLSHLQEPPQQNDVDAARKAIANLQTVSLTHRKADDVLSACKPLQRPPETHPAFECRQLLSRLKTTEAGLQVAEQTTTAFFKLKPPPALSNTERLVSLVLQLPAAKLHNQKLQQRLAVYAQLYAQQQPASTAELSEITRQLRQRTLQSRQKQHTLIGFKPLKTVPALTDGAPLRELLQSIKQSEKSLTEFRSNLTDALLSLKNCMAAVRTFVAASPDCPTCGARLDPEQLIATASGLGLHHHSSSVKKGDS